MKDNEYYKAIDKAAAEWRRKNAFVFPVTPLLAKTVQITYISVLKDLEKSVLGFRDLQKHIGALNVEIRSIESAPARIIREANLQMSAVLASFQPYQDFVKRLQEDQRRWAESLKASIGVMSRAEGIAATLRWDFSLMTKSALFAQQSTARINLQTIGEAANIDSNLRATLCERLIEMADSYRALWDGFRIDSQKVFSVPLVVSKGSTIEMYLSAHQAEASTKEAEVVPEEEEFLAEIEPSVQHMHEVIASIDVRLIPLYEGAIDAIAYDNVDRVRHAITSLRELFTHILHRLAPDEAFFKWNEDDSNLDNNGRPTRRGRLLYICRSINYGAFTTFLDRDISVALKFLDLLQKGTHALESPYDERQLKALLIRMESLLDFIIRISRHV